ncbi:cytochrome-c peroxidase [Salmonirosea aquatica]
MHQRKILFLVLGAYLLISFRMVSSRLLSRGIATEYTVQYYEENAVAFAQKTKVLEQDIINLSSDSSTLRRAIKSLTDCRLQYKKIEFFTAYFFDSETRSINAAPVYEVEEPTLELVEPMGLQQIEALLFDDNHLRQKPELLLQAQLLRNTASELTTLLYHFELTDAQILESLRINLIRVITLSISGYDAPELKTGIREAAVALKAMNEPLVLFIGREDIPSSDAEDLTRVLNQAIRYLDQNSDFDSFDRMTFLRDYALPLQTALARAVRGWGLELQTEDQLNYRADHLFSRGAIRFGTAASLSQAENSKRLLGEKLFAETALSGNGDRSCTTCHQPTRYFSDNLFRSTAVNPDSSLKRNTPTLLYAAVQHFQFWDGRSKNLQEQIVHVIFNPLELNADPKRISQEILNSKNYQKLLVESFPEIDNQEFTTNDIADALAAYLTTLQPFNSTFDQYVNGDLAALTDRQINGFNLFMGKAQCGTCHFLPYFNSLLPPHYDVSEVEVLGTPADADLDHPKKDSDRGRHDLYPIHFYDAAFKTPTVRNAAKTAPYMHNGAFETLTQVIEFYNRGGGTGIGLHVPDQTLSGKPLDLTPSEIEDITLFIESLTDKI